MQAIDRPYKYSRPGSGSCADCGPASYIVREMGCVRQWLVVPWTAAHRTWKAEDQGSFIVRWSSAQLHLRDCISSRRLCPQPWHRQRHHARRPRPRQVPVSDDNLPRLAMSPRSVVRAHQPNQTQLYGRDCDGARDTAGRQVDRGANVSNWQAAAREGKEMKCCMAAG
jgi:hypothetical protein